MTDLNLSPLLPLINHGNGTLTDPNSGLMWKIQPEGCFDWHEATLFNGKTRVVDYAGCTDWRLPNTRELHTLLDVDFPPYTFPQPPQSFEYPSSFWTSDADDWDGAWLIEFGTNRGAFHALTYHRMGVRLVRDAVNEACTTFTDSKTGLMWKIQPEGCFDWDEAALFDGKTRVVECAGFTDWRLPTLDELHTLLDVDFPPYTFPQPLESFDHPYHFWSSVADNWGCGWLVGFGTDRGVSNALTYLRMGVRLVRVA